MGREDRKLPSEFAQFEELDIVQRPKTLPQEITDLDLAAMPEIMRICSIRLLADRHAALAEALAKGEDPDARCPFGAMPIDTLYTDADGKGLAMLLAYGADMADYGWTDAHLAVIAGDVAALRGCDPALLEQPDNLGDTPFLLACRFGPPAIVQHLMPKPIPEMALLIAAESGDVAVMAALIDGGADVNATVEDGNCALLSAVEHGRTEMVAAVLQWGASLEQRIDLSLPPVRNSPSVVTGLDLMVARMMDQPQVAPDPVFTTIYTAAKVPEMIRVLVAYGADPTQFVGAGFAAAVGLDQVPPPSITRDVFAAGYRVRFGQANPERVDPLFWQAQMRSCKSGAAAKAASIGTEIRTQGPIWSFDRVGRSATKLPSGDWLLIGGHQGDPNDPNYAIHNDVTIVSPAGAIRHFVYPPSIFPPTSFHTATCVDAGVWIIGGRGYRRDGMAGVTSVTWLSLDDFSMNPLRTFAQKPGAIYGHKARLVDGAIYVGGGKSFPDGKPMRKSLVLDLASRAWHPVN